MFMEFLKAFLIGGVICAVGQVLIDYTKLTPARILVSFVVAGASSMLPCSLNDILMSVSTGFHLGWRAWLFWGCRVWMTRNRQHCP